MTVIEPYWSIRQYRNDAQMNNSQFFALLDRLADADDVDVPAIIQANPVTRSWQLALALDMCGTDDETKSLFIEAALPLARELAASEQFHAELQAARSPVIVALARNVEHASDAELQAADPGALAVELTLRRYDQHDLSRDYRALVLGEA
jgi:hypothetical protein